MNPKLRRLPSADWGILTHVRLDSNFILYLQSRTESCFFPVDYGGDVAGKPTFSVTAVDDYAQIEVKFSEAYK
jgi:hypothetical protein